MEKFRTELLQRIEKLEYRLDLILSTVKGSPNKSKYMTAQDIEREMGIDQRTILNRSNLHPTDKRFIPSLTMNGRRKYFERKVIERLLQPKR